MRKAENSARASTPLSKVGVDDLVYSVAIAIDGKALSLDGKI